ncbi:mitochondrial D-lactate ferricytochrome c oxidoreductase [Scheffersomyces coipomensis]|uniref:mitochondrial D-lactate ferricytochrome c oxidoreductase n=1 Tax=Scheffersomyces coipomensis TaxID=1788519 RepID=UPI00315C6C49
MWGSNLKKNLISRRSLTFTRLQSTGKSSPTIPAPPLPPKAKSSSLGYALVGLLFLGGGIYLGSQYNSIFTTAPLKSSTTTIESLPPLIYADDNQFQQGISEIKAILTPDQFNYDEEVIKSQSDSFFSTHHPPKPQDQKPKVIISPNNTQEVSDILKIANKYHIPIVANSGLTSLEGQTMHTRGPNSIALSFSHLNNIVEFHPDDLDIVVQPGVGWSELDDYLKSHPLGSHLLFPVDPGLGATIAGMVATSASGTNAYKYGTMKENVVNLTVVLADGSIIKTKQRPRKSSAGYDLTRLFIGSEGTLGIITEITIKLHVRPKRELVSIASFPTIKDASATAQEIINKSGLQLNAIEILDETTVSFVNDGSSKDKKFDEKPTLFFKIGGPSDQSINEQVKVIKEIANRNHLIKFQNSHNEEENAVLWSARRQGLWSTFEYGNKVLPDPNDVQIWTTDIAVPLSKVSQVITETNDDLNNSGFKGKFSVMGHIGDGNCHFLLLYNSPDYHKTKTLVDRMVERALKYEGTSTGEHGVGVGKRKYLEKEFSPSSLDLMRHIKLSLDPHRILNPDKIFIIDKDDNLDELLEAGHIQSVNKHDCCH